MKPDAHDFPAAFLDAMSAMLGEEYPAFLSALDAPAALALRLNPLRFGAEAAAAPWTDGPVPWAAQGRYLRPLESVAPRPGGSIAHAAGAFYLQEASAMASAAALDAQPGEIVLDLCAAPGGKSTQLAAALGNRGVLIANDPEPARAKVLAGNLERMGAANAVVVNALPRQLAERWPERFDAILVDAPCSGEGMFRRDPAARSEWNPAAPAGCAKRQAEILDRAAEMLRPGGRLVYSTCTFNEAENEGSVRAFLSRRGDFAPEDFALPGVGESSGGMLRLFPHRLRGDGHFVARLRKAGEPVRRAACPKAVRPDPAVQALLAMLAEEVCALPDFLSGADLALRGDRLYAVPADAPPTEGLRVVTPGLCLLRAMSTPVRGKTAFTRVEPDHALAMALPPALAHRTADLDDARAAAFLSGEALPFGGARGWTLALWRGMPLGWGKCADGQLKNHLPKGLRRRG